jgi:predicted RNA-binding Zn ribbon-like protein
MVNIHLAIFVWTSPFHQPIPIHAVTLCSLITNAYNLSEPFMRLSGKKRGRRSPRASFIAECRGLDFVNSGDSPETSQLDWMGSGERLIGWLEQAGLVPRAVLRKFRPDARSGKLDRVASRARELREWLRAVIHKYRGGSFAGVDISVFETLNRILLEDERYIQIARSHGKGPPLTLRLMRRWSAPDSLVWAIAESVAHLIYEEDFGQIKQCEGCSLLFLCRTRRHERKWCSMSTCGNRAKQAAHRNRQKPPQA